MKALTLNFKTAQTDFQSLINFALKILWWFHQSVAGGKKNVCVGPSQVSGSAKKYLKSAKLVHVSTAHYDHLFGRAIRQMKALTLNFKTAQTDFQSPINFSLKILKNIFSTFYENTRSVVTSRHDHLFLRSIQEMKALTLNFKMTQSGFESPIDFPLKFLKKMLSRPNAKHTKRHNFSPRPSSHGIFHETKALNPPPFL